MLLNYDAEEDSIESIGFQETKSVKPKGNQSWYSLKGLMLKLKFQYFGQLTGKADSVEKISMLGKFNSVAQSCPTLATTWTAAHQDSLSITNSQSLFKLESIKLVMPSNLLILCCPLLLQPSIFRASGSLQMSQFYSSDGQSIGVSASASVLPMNSQDWFNSGWAGWICLRVQGTLKSLLQHQSLKASILQCSAFFIVQLSHAYMTTGKTIALTRWTLLAK